MKRRNLKKDEDEKLINVVFTSVGGEIIPGIIDSLRSESSYDFHIIGVDMKENAVGRQLVDEFYTVPGGLDDDYIPRMLEIVNTEDVDIVIPLSDQETLSLSQHKQDLLSNGSKVLTPDGQKVKVASDKGSMLEFLDRKGVEVPEYYIPESFSELDKAVSELGYPEKDVVIKPRRQRAARGFWILSDEREPRDLVLNEKCLQMFPYKHIRKMLKNGDEFPELVAMQYLKGDDFNVDCLSIDGESVYEIPIKRIEPSAGPVQVGEITHDTRAQKMAKEICDAFEFELNTNVEIAYRDSTSKGKPLVYEINPRISGPIAVHRQAGVNLLLYGILSALGKEIPKNKDFKEIRFHRCWQEIYFEEE